MRVIVCGGRNYRNEVFIWRTLDRLHSRYHFTDFMQGGADGADKIAGDWAKTKPELNGRCWVCRADWRMHGKSAGPIRNSRMLEWEPDLVIAFPDFYSKGTWDMVRKAKNADVGTIVVYEE
jgi:YspA, cpYpsA-related SLOG family